MAVAEGPFLAPVLLLISLGLSFSSVLPECPEPCTCQSPSLLNCSSSGISLLMQHIPDSVTELDLSHNLLDSITLNRPHRNLQNVWLGSNRITRLSLCMEGNLGTRTRSSHRFKPWSRRRCVSWAPAMQVLSAERNQLEQLPEGLNGSESLRVLQLSFNRISTLQPRDLNQLPHLTELHLQHNLIASLHPQMFQDLTKLRVLDLSFNRLTNLHPGMYGSLRNIGTDVRLHGNRWHCDCTMRTLRRRMTYDSIRGLQVWDVVCANPSILVGRDLLQLEEDELNCFGTENRADLHQDVTVYSGSKILLSCSSQDSLWLTPSGEPSGTELQAGLLITDITDKDAGLYVCTSEEDQVVSVYNLQISKTEGAKRRIRSLSRASQQIIPYHTSNTKSQAGNQGKTKSEFIVAVCLSIFVTFLIAFVLGVLARPYIDGLLIWVTEKRNSPETSAESTTEERQYDNEAFSNSEEPEVIIHRERRVTFSTVDFKKHTNVQNDTVANGGQETLNNDAVIECETNVDSGSGNDSQLNIPEKEQKEGRDLSGVADTDCPHNTEFEHIQDPVEKDRRRSLSSCSDSSLSDKVCDKDQNIRRDRTAPKSPQLVEDSVLQRTEVVIDGKAEVSQTSTESREDHISSSEPIADWSPNRTIDNLTNPDLWQENEEQFDFDDSFRSTSERSSSVCVFFNNSNLLVTPTLDKEMKEERSNSSSSVSEVDPTEDTVNSEKEKVEQNHSQPQFTNILLKQGAGFRNQTHGADPSGGFNGSSPSSDSDGEDYRGEVKALPPTKKKVSGLVIASQRKSLDRITSPPAADPSSSSSESEEDEGKGLKAELSAVRVNEQIKINERETFSTDPDSRYIPQIKAPSAASNPSSSDDSMDETTKHSNRQEREDVIMNGLPVKENLSVSLDANEPQWPSIELSHVSHTKRLLDIKSPSLSIDSSSSSESDDGTSKDINMQDQGQMHKVTLATKESPTLGHDPQTQWPVINLEDSIRIKRRLDINARSLASVSSSISDSDEETTGHTEKPSSITVETTSYSEKKRLVKLDNAGLQLQVFQTESHDSGKSWPVLDLENSTRIKKRLDIKAPTHSYSSSSSDNEDETTSHIKKQKQIDKNMSKHPTKVSPTTRPQTQWPVLNLENSTRIKRRLDIKAPLPDSDSSSSSDSQDETTSYSEKQRLVKLDNAGLQLQVFQTQSHDLGKSWPLLDLEKSTRIKKRLDIKAPLPDSDSSSSSDNEDETTSHIKKQKQIHKNMSKHPTKVSPTTKPQTQWPVLNLENSIRIKRRLDIKAPLPDPDSSSSSDSEDGTTSHIKKQKQIHKNMSKHPTKVSPTTRPQTQWPVLNLENSTRIKRRLDIKAPLPDSDSSSSSDSQDETTSYSEKKRLVKLDNAGLQLQVFQTESHDLGKSWPLLDLEKSTRIKKRLDIKAPTHCDSSSSSDSEDGTNQMEKHRPGKVDINILQTEGLQLRSQSKDKRRSGHDLDYRTPVKRRLDIKATSPDSHSSSSSDSEDGTTSHIKKQKQIDKIMSKHPTKVSPTTRPQTQWPVLNLENSTRIKRRLDIKAPLPDSDSSSSSDSQDETTSYSEKQRLVKLDNAGLQLQVFQTQSHDLGKSWPLLDLEKSTRIKKRLDIKAPLPDSDSSSSSDNEYETTSHIKKQKQIDKNMSKHPTKVSPTTKPQTQWPVLNLENSTRIKRRLDIKAPLPDPDSSSSSDSEDGTTSHIKKQKQIHKNMSKHPTKVSPTTRPQTQWPVLNLENSTRIKRRLDIRATSPDSDSSSSSDSEDGTTSHIKKQKQIDKNMSKHPTKVSPTTRPQTQWPVLNLENSTHIKRRLDIKAPLPDSDSSSSSDSQDETTSYSEKQRLVKLDNAGLQLQVFQTQSHDLGKSWPLLDLEKSTRIKKRLDIKEPTHSDSSSSSDSEDGTKQMEKHRPGKVDIVIPQTEGLQLRSQSKDKRRSGHDLDYRTPVKRRLDIKATSPDPDSSSSSDSEDGTTSHIKKQKQIDKIMSKHPTKVSPTTRPQTQWPVLNLENSTRIKRRLDIKAPLPDSDSSSSSDSQDETTSYTEKQRLVKLDNAGLQLQVFQTESHDLGKSWPLLDLEKSTRIKRRLDIKAPLPDSDSSSSSDSEHGTNQIEKNRPGKVDIDILQTEGLQLRNQSKDKRRSGLHLEYRTPVKRRLDIKATSPDPDSSSSSDSEDGRTHDVKKEERRETYMPRIPAGVSQTVSQEPQSNWPALNLEDSTRVKRRLDIIVKSINSDSCSSSDSADETGKIKKQSSRWPVPDLVVVQGLGRTTHIKTRVDIQPPDLTSSSGDSESETTHQSKKERSGLMESVPFREYQTEGSDPQSMWPVVDLSNITHVRRRLDIKVASPHPDLVLSAGSMIYPAKGKRKTAIKMSHRYLSSSSDDEEEERMEDLRNAPTTVEIIPDSRWPKLSLNDTPNVKRRLDIRVRSPSSDSSSSESEAGIRITEQPVKVERDRPNIWSAGHQPGAKPPDLSMSIPLTKRHLNIKAPVQPVDPCSSSSNNEGRVSRPAVKYEINKGDLELTDHEQQKPLDKRSLGDLYPKRRLDIKGPSPQPDPNLSSVAPGFPRSESTSSNSDSEDELKDHAKLGLGVFAISKTKEKEFIKSPETPVIFTHHSPKTDTSIKLEKYTAITDDVRAKTGSDTIHTPQINPVPESQWATMSLGISRFRKLHEITSTSHESLNLSSSAPTISLSSSSRDKGRRTRRKRGEVEMQGVILTKSSLMAENTVEFTPPKTEETFGPGFGIPLFRRHPDLKISERSPVTPPLLLQQQQQRGSSSSIDSENASVKYLGKRWEGISQLPVVTNKEASQIQTYLHTNQAVSIDLDLSHSQSSEVGDKFDSVQLRALSQRETSPSSSSNSENETNDHSVPDQSLGWHIEIKASSPGPDNPSSSSSEDDNKVTANQTVHESAMSGMSDDSALLTYKPVIFKELPPLSNSVSYSSPTRDHSIQRHSVVSITEQGLFHGVDGKGVSIPPKGVSSMSFDEVLRKRIEQSREATHVNASSEISWTGTSHDLSISSVMRHRNMGSSTPTSGPLDSSNCSRNASDDKSKQDSGEADGMQMHKDTVDSSPGRRNEFLTDRSEDRRTRKGLSAIKAMSSERQKWDSKAENLDRSASPLFDDPGQQAGTRFNYPRSKDLKPLPKQPQTQSRLSSASADESGSPYQLYEIPHYRSHHIGPPQEASPPIPATLPPDESVGPTSGSEQSSRKQVLERTRSYLQQSSNTVESDPSPDVSQNPATYFYSSHNISHV